VRAVVSSREIQLTELLEYDIVNKLNQIMQELVQSNAEWASDHLLIIMNEILHLSAEVKKQDEVSQLPQQVFNQLLVNFKYFSKLLSASDIVRTPFSFSLYDRYLCSLLWKELRSTC
jgi:hypothetical protein